MNKSNDKKTTGNLVKSRQNTAKTKDELIRSGVEHFTQFGFSASGLDKILKKVSVPKGSFYYYFENKEAFGLAVISYYDQYFSHKLDLHLTNEQLPLAERLMEFVKDAKAGITKYEFNRGCLVGNLEQEVALLPDSHRQALMQVMKGWQNKVSVYLGQLYPAYTDADCDALAEFFWLGWEGAVSRCRLAKTTGPIDLYIHHFLQLLDKR